MTYEKFEQAKDLDSRISILSYDLNLAEFIKTEFVIKIVGRNPAGDERVLASLEKDDALRMYIADVIKERLIEERESLINQFKNL